VIDLKLLRASPGQVRAALDRRGDASLTRLLDEIEALDMKRRTLTAQLDTFKAERNDAAKSDAISAKSQGGLPASIVAERKKLGDRITNLESELRQIETTLEAKALFVPNSPLPEVPDEQTTLRSWGTPAPKGGKPHWEIGEQLRMLDLPSGAKLAGSGFPVLKGMGARLARALINFMLDLHTREHGYMEVEPPFLVRREIMIGTGQLPKFEDDVYRTTEDLFLVPTAEVPVTNLHRDEILDGTTLPLGYVAYTPCFRREGAPRGKTRAGSCASINSTKWSWCASVARAIRPRSTKSSPSMPKRCCGVWSSPIAWPCCRPTTSGSRRARRTISRRGRPASANGSKCRARARSPIFKRAAPTSAVAHAPARSRSSSTP